jgi:hypothetical protein
MAASKISGKDMEELLAFSDEGEVKLYQQP